MSTEQIRAPLDLSLLEEPVTEPKLIKLASFRSSHGVQSRGTVLNQLHGGAPAFVERSREHVKVVLDIAMLYAKLEISLRGHKETEDGLNKGHFF